MHRSRDILEILLAQIGKLNREFAADPIVGGRRDADAARFGNALKPGRNIDTVTENVVARWEAMGRPMAPRPITATCRLLSGIVGSLFPWCMSGGTADHEVVATSWWLLASVWMERTAHSFSTT